MDQLAREIVAAASTRSEFSTDGFALLIDLRHARYRVSFPGGGKEPAVTVHPPAAFMTRLVELLGAGADNAAIADERDYVTSKLTKRRRGKQVS